MPNTAATPSSAGERRHRRDRGIVEPDAAARDAAPDRPSRSATSRETPRARSRRRAPRPARAGARRGCASIAPFSQRSALSRIRTRPVNHERRPRRSVPRHAGAPAGSPSSAVRGRGCAAVGAALAVDGRGRVGGPHRRRHGSSDRSGSCSCCSRRRRGRSSPPTREPSRTARSVVVAIGVAFAIAARGPATRFARPVVVRDVRPHGQRAPREPVRARAERLPRTTRSSAAVAAGWRHTTSVYGPLFTGVSAALDARRGSLRAARPPRVPRARRARRRRARSCWSGGRHAARAHLRSSGCTRPWSLAIVNGGHNDALVGLAVLAGALLAGRRRWCGAGFVLGARDTREGVDGTRPARHRRVEHPSRPARRGATRAGRGRLTTVVGYLPAGIVARARGRARGQRQHTRVGVGPHLAASLHPNATVALIAVVLLAAAVAYRRRTASRPDVGRVARRSRPTWSAACT